MTRRKGLYLIPGILGLLATAIGLLFYPFHRMTRDDMYVAFRKPVQIPLRSLEMSGSSTVVFHIPDTEQWTHIRKEWSEPRYVSAIDSGPLRNDSHEVINLEDAGVKVELFRAGKTVSLNITNQPPYGFSSYSLNSCLEFRASPGDELTLHVTSVKQTAQPEGAELFVIADWHNTKDLIVGAMISEDLLPYSRGAIVVGCLLFVAAVVIRTFVVKKMTPH